MSFFKNIFTFCSCKKNNEDEIEFNQYEPEATCTNKASMSLHNNNKISNLIQNTNNFWIVDKQKNNSNNIQHNTIKRIIVSQVINSEVIEYKEILNNNNK